MYFVVVLLLTLATLVLDVQGVNIPDDAIRRVHLMVPRTLQESAPTRKAGLAFDNNYGKRQGGSCGSGEACIDGGCCPVGYQCVGAFTPGSGCCPTGQNCSGPPTGCPDSTQTPCVGTNICCPATLRCPPAGSEYCLFGSDTTGAATTSHKPTDTTGPPLPTKPLIPNSLTTTNENTVVPAAVTTTTASTTTPTNSPVASTNVVGNNERQSSSFERGVLSLMILVVGILAF